MHYGDAKKLPWAAPKPFQGNSISFTVTSNPVLLRQLLATASPSTNGDAAADMQHAALCQFVDSNLWPHGVDSGNSSLSTVEEFQQAQGLQQTSRAVRRRLGCLAQQH